MYPINSRTGHTSHSFPLRSTPSSSPHSKHGFITPPHSNEELYFSQFRHRANGIDSPPISSSELSELLVTQLEKSRIDFGVVDCIPLENTTNRSKIRDQLVTHFPDLVSRPQQAAVKLKPNATPPALTPRPTKTSERERASRKDALTLNLERRELRSVIKGQVVLESRKIYFKRMRAADEGAFCEDFPVMPSPWLVSLDISHLLAEGRRKSKKTYEMPDFKFNVACESCSGSRLVPCTTCSSIEADECFWCSGVGVRRGGKLDGKVCTNCNGKGQYQCSLCNNSGELECTNCNSSGVVEMGTFIDLSLRSIELPAIPLDALCQGGFSPNSEEAVRSMAVDAVLSSIERICQSTKADVAPVMARCIWEKSSMSTIEVIKPLLKWRGKEGLEDLASSTEVEIRHFNVSSNPKSKPQEVHSRPRSRNTSISVSPVISPSTSMGDLRLAINTLPGLVESRKLRHRKSLSKSLSKIFGGLGSRSSASLSSPIRSGFFSPDNGPECNHTSSPLRTSASAPSALGA